MDHQRPEARHGDLTKKILSLGNGNKHYMEYIIEIYSHHAITKALIDQSREDRLHSIIGSFLLGVGSFYRF